MGGGGCGLLLAVYRVFTKVTFGISRKKFYTKMVLFREILSNFVYFRITFYTTFRIIWHDFHTKFRIPSNKNLTNNKCL